MEGCLLTDHRSEVSERAEAYLEELRAATAAAHERLRMGVMRLHPQAPIEVDQAPAQALDGEFPPELDPIFATREFDVPAEAVGALVSFDSEEDFSLDR